MSGRVHVTGLTELMRELSNAPEEIRADGMDIVRDTTERAAADLRNEYEQHHVSGTLARRVTASYPASGALVGVIQSTAPHSHLFEWGTKARTSASGANRGVMPKANVVVRVARSHRERMETRLMAMLANRGFLVSEQD